MIKSAVAEWGDYSDKGKLIVTLTYDQLSNTNIDKNQFSIDSVDGKQSVSVLSKRIFTGISYIDLEFNDYKYTELNGEFKNIYYIEGDNPPKDRLGRNVKSPETVAIPIPNRPAEITSGSAIWLDVDSNGTVDDLEVRINYSKNIDISTIPDPSTSKLFEIETDIGEGLTSYYEIYLNPDKLNQIVMFFKDYSPDQNHPGISELIYKNRNLKDIDEIPVLEFDKIKIIIPEK
jgi:hypothetical protein